MEPWLYTVLSSVLFQMTHSGTANSWCCSLKATVNVMTS